MATPLRRTSLVMSIEKLRTLATRELVLVRFLSSEGLNAARDSVFLGAGRRFRAQMGRSDRFSAVAARQSGFFSGFGGCEASRFD